MRCWLRRSVAVLLVAVGARGFVVPSGRLGRLASRSSTSVVALSTSDDLLDQAAKLRAEVAAEEAALAPTTPSITPEDAKAKVTAALKRATSLRDKEQLKIALTAAEQAGFAGSDPVVDAAVTAYNELTELTDTMRQRLKQEVQSQGADPSSGWNPGYTYLGIFGLITLLVLTAGKDIFF
mmetsp:Transcript_29905/g.96496  ORF Transcript_29905/g.96496 Transcript_29905/m.96496 type:complete len:180 (+) Transcript_29905:60-599(+)